MIALAFQLKVYNLEYIKTQMIIQQYNKVALKRNIYKSIVVIPDY